MSLPVPNFTCLQEKFTVCSSNRRPLNVYFSGHHSQREQVSVIYFCFSSRDQSRLASNNNVRGEARFFYRHFIDLPSELHVVGVDRYSQLLFCDYLWRVAAE
jgi:hypothetical protein